MIEVELTATARGEGGMTMESRAQAWDALNAQGVPPEARLRVNAYAPGNWDVRAAWTPPEPVVEDVEIPVKFHMDTTRDLFRGADPEDVAEAQDLYGHINQRIQDNLAAVREQLDQPLFKQTRDVGQWITATATAHGVDPAKVAEAVTKRHRAAGYLDL
jgi:hypothetical protein